MLRCSTVVTPPIGIIPPRAPVALVARSTSVAQVVHPAPSCAHSPKTNTIRLSRLDSEWSPCVDIRRSDSIQVLTVGTSVQLSSLRTPLHAIACQLYPVACRLLHFSARHFVALRCTSLHVVQSSPQLLQTGSRFLPMNPRVETSTLSKQPQVELLTIF